MILGFFFLQESVAHRNRVCKEEENKTGTNYIRVSSQRLSLRYHCGLNAGVLSHMGAGIDFSIEKWIKLDSKTVP